MSLDGAISSGPRAAHHADYYAPVPRRATFAGGLTGEKHRVFSYLSGLSRGGDEEVRRLNAQIAVDLDLHVGTVRRILAELKTDHPPGVDHPYIQTFGTSQCRRTWCFTGRGKPVLPARRGARERGRSHGWRGRQARPRFPSPLIPRRLRRHPFSNEFKRKATFT